MAILQSQQLSQANELGTLTPCVKTAGPQAKAIPLKAFGLFAKLPQVLIFQVAQFLFGNNRDIKDITKTFAKLPFPLQISLLYGNNQLVSRILRASESQFALLDKFLQNAILMIRNTLTVLDLHDSTLSPTALKRIFKIFPNISSLNVPRCSISNKGFEVLSCHTRLTLLNLTGSTNLTRNGLQFLPRLKNLRYLSLSFCTGLQNEDLKFLSTLTQLQKLDLSFTPIKGNGGLTHISALPRLKYLDITCCQIDDAAVPYLSLFTKLKRLNCSWTAISSDGFDRLTLSDSLNALNLEGTNVSDKTVLKISSRQILDVLNIQACQKLTEISLKHLKTQEHLVHFRVDFCSLIPIPLRI
jgi:hypothetical protein